MHDLGRDDRFVDLFHRVLEQLAILRLVDGGRVCTQQLDAILVEEAVGNQLHRNVQTSLAAQRRQNGVRTLLLDDFLYTRDGHRLNINLVCHRLVRHDGRRVGVYQNDLKTFFAQRAAGLRACIVKLCCLTDDNRAGAEYHYLMNIVAQRHY